MNEPAKKKLLQMIPHALYILIAEANGKTAASTVSWVTQASFKPPLIALGARADSQTFEILKQSKNFILNYLGENQKDIAQKFYKHVDPTENSIAGEAFVRSPLHKLPTFPHMAGYLECTITDIVEHGDHAVVVAEVIAAELGSANGPLLLNSTGWSYGG
ncbi:MAG TPA: flavin reductase family protein [bacterium]|nr:flavin reductase family protein [bacterium]